jgi:hypothetical protein
MVHEDAHDHEYDELFIRVMIEAIQIQIMYLIDMEYDGPHMTFSVIQLLLGLPINLSDEIYDMLNKHGDVDDIVDDMIRHIDEQSMRLCSTVFSHTWMTNFSSQMRHITNIKHMIDKIGLPEHHLYHEVMSSFRMFAMRIFENSDSGDNIRSNIFSDEDYNAIAIKTCSSYCIEALKALIRSRITLPMVECIYAVPDYKCASMFPLLIMSKDFNPKRDVTHLFKRADEMKGGSLLLTMLTMKPVVNSWKFQQSKQVLIKAIKSVKKFGDFEAVDKISKTYGSLM